MNFDNAMTEELTESSANFDPLLNQDMLRHIYFRDLSRSKKTQKKYKQFVAAKQDLDEFEQFLT